MIKDDTVLPVIFIEDGRWTKAYALDATGEDRAERIIVDKKGKVMGGSFCRPLEKLPYSWKLNNPTGPWTK